MTVMSTNTRELDISTLVLTAYQYAGVMNEMQAADGPQWDARRAYGCRQLELIIDALGAAGVYERSVEFYDLLVASGATTTEVPQDTIDFIGDGMLHRDDGSTWCVEASNRETYQAITTKEDSGLPLKYFLHRGAPMKVYLWPRPDADCTITFQRQRLTYDNKAGAATTDLERFWADYLVHELAYRLAMSNGMSTERCALLMGKAGAAKLVAQGKAGDQLPNQIVVSHRGPYRSYR